MERDYGAEPSSVRQGAQALSIGDVVAGRYRVEGVIGRGGMSVVYRATHLALERTVALKVLSVASGVIPEHVSRLAREARAVSLMRTQHVARVHDMGELPRGVPYVVMELLHGADLATVLSHRGSLPVPLAIECVMQSCEALAEAHALGVVHRDLKPANLFLTESVDGSPCVKVLDFGISRMVAQAALTPLTDPGTVVGTPRYMAPEQMEGVEPVDARSDIWALGAILYELLTGQPPYAGDTVAQIFVRIMRSKAPKPSALNPKVPSDLDAVVTRCLSIEASDRYATVAELAWALARIGTQGGRDSAERISRVLEKRGGLSMQSTSPPSGSHLAALAWWTSGRRVLVTSACALLLGGFVGASMFSGKHEPTRRNASVVNAGRPATPTMTATDARDGGAEP